tara:strand:+ start:3491 stop:3772 length:282 start_codon:yes stop_codon:yes gene_type:complete
LTNPWYDCKIYPLTIREMSTSSSFISKFKTQISLLEQAVNREVDIDHRHPKIYKKILRFYRNEGVQFYNDPEDDYELVLELISEDLYKEGIID